MSLFVRPSFSALVLAALCGALVFVGLHTLPTYLLVLIVICGLLELAIAVVNPVHRAEVRAEEEARAAFREAMAKLNDDQKRLIGLLPAVEAKATQVVDQIEADVNQAETVVKADASKVLTGAEKIAADIADELKKA